MEEFLHWIKDLDAALHRRADDSCNLMVSGLREPLNELFDLMQGRLAEVRARLGEPNHWGHAAVVERLRQRYQIPHDRHVQVTAGATAAMWLVCCGLLSGQRGARVLVEEPVYEPLRLIPARLGAAVDLLPRRPEQGYRIDPDELASRVTADTRLVILTSLHNPSSARLDHEGLLRGLEGARRRSPGVRVIVDETFHDFVREEQGSAAGLDPAVVVVSTLTKVYGLGLLRCGWVVGTEDVIRAVRVPWVDSAGIGSRPHRGAGRGRPGAHRPLRAALARRIGTQPRGIAGTGSAHSEGRVASR